MSNPFKKITYNAAESKNTLYDGQIREDATINTRNCDTCGAPRPKHSDITICSYCKNSVYADNNGNKSRRLLWLKMRVFQVLVWACL